MAPRSDKQPLSEQRVLEEALALVDGGGMASLSMRRLGSALGVDPMAVYYYFPSKDALLRRVVLEAFGTISRIATEGTWQQRVLAWAQAYRDLALEHPNLILQLVSYPDAIAASTAAANEALYAALEEAGLTPPRLIAVADLVVDYVNGFVLAEAGRRSEASSPPQPANLASFPVQRRIIEAAAGERPIDAFDSAIEVILGGAGGWAAEPTSVT